MTDAPAMTHREVLESMSGLLLGLLVAILSSTVVSAALPTIIEDLRGSQSSFTWVVTATLLTMTVSTPIWGKLADLFDRKLLVQTALVIFVVGSALAGLAQSTQWLIGCRAIQGIGVGGLTALVQVVLSDLVSPRERGRYMGILGSVMAVGTVAGPLLGGVITDSFLGWRWCFFVGVPIAVAALITLQRTLHLPPRTRRAVKIDYLGAALISAGVSAILIWVSLAGHQFAWASAQTAILVTVGVVSIAAAIRVEVKSDEPLIPTHLFRDRTPLLAVIASASVGVGLFGTSVFLSQYLQIARGESPTASGLLTIPMMAGILTSSTLIGRRITKTGRYKKWMVAGAAMLTVGMALMGTLDEHTSLVQLSLFMALVGLGVGMVMQNLVLVVQNSVPLGEIGSASALVTFFRSLGGASGVAVLGAVLGSRASASITQGLAERGVTGGAAAGGGSTSIPDPGSLPGPVRAIVEHAYASGTAEIFMVAAPLGLVALIAIALLKEVPLGTRSGVERQAEVDGALAAGATGEGGGDAPVTGARREQEPALAG